MEDNKEEKKSRIDLVVKYTPKEKDILAKVSEPVVDFGDDLKALIDRMSATMYFYEAIGISAIQIGVPKQVFLIKNGNDQFSVFINPKVLEASEETDIQNEGCLSFPNIFVPVERSKKITIGTLDMNGEEREGYLEGLHARIFLHEKDHLSGVTFMDHISLLKKNLVLDKMKKLEKTGKIKRDEYAVNYIEALVAAQEGKDNG